MSYFTTKNKTSTLSVFKELLIWENVLSKLSKIYYIVARYKLFYPPYNGGDPSTPSGSDTLLRLHPNHLSYLKWPPPKRVRLSASGITDFRGVTGGVYNTRERIHPDILIRDY